MGLLFDLGWSIGRVNAGHLEIIKPEDSSEGFHEPSAKIVICRKQDIDQLKLACDEALKAYEKF